MTRGRPPKPSGVVAPPNDPGQVHTRGRWYSARGLKHPGKLVSVNRLFLEGDNIDHTKANRFYYEYGLKFTDSHDEIISWWRAEELSEVPAPRKRAKAAEVMT